jgi:glycosyltransferase involved in cell wall biosynthesis
LRVLFVHQNFPGQFVHVAKALAERGHDVRAVTDDGNGRPEIVPTLRYKVQAPNLRAVPVLARTFADRTLRGEAVALALAPLAAEGWAPDAVVVHPGWGEAFFLRDVFPAARLIAFAEFYYAAKGADTDFDPEFPSAAPGAHHRIRARNAAMLPALVEADVAVAPTQWQRSRFPADVQHKIVVLHEGVDTAAIAPRPGLTMTFGRGGHTLAHGDEIITFVNRNLEPYRGYHRLMRALPAILEARPNAHVVLVGGDGVSYGAAPPSGMSWKTVFLAEVGRGLPMDRVHFVGRVPHAQFVALMQMSAAHVYLTYPFVLSWSMLEAMSAGALVIGSRTPPVEEVIRHGENGLLVDFFDTHALAVTVADVLGHQDEYRPLRAAARETVVANYDLATRCLPAWIRLVEDGAP